MSDKNSDLDHTVGTFPLYPTDGASMVSPSVYGVPLYEQRLTKHGLRRYNPVVSQSEACPWPSSPPLSGSTCPPGTDRTTNGKTCCTAYDMAGAANLGQVGYGSAAAQWGPRQPMPSFMVPPVAALAAPTVAALAAPTVAALAAPTVAALAAPTAAALAAPTAAALAAPTAAALAAPTAAAPTAAAPTFDAVAAALGGGKKYEALKERANRNIRKARKNIEKLKGMCSDLLKLNDDLIKQNMKLKKHISGGKCGCQSE